MTRITLTLGVLVTLALNMQRAEAHNVCTALETPDGFVALRDKPSTKGKLLARMKPGDFVVVDKVGYEWVVSDNWYRVSHYSGGDIFPEPGEAEFRNVKRGWAHERYIGECG